MTATRRDLEELLAVAPDHLRTWERSEFDRHRGGRDIVLMGAGGLGRRTLAGLRKVGIEPLAFADNAAGEGERVRDGVPVLSPHEAALAFGKRAVFVVTIWGANRPHRYEHSRAQLESLGCEAVCPFPPLFWKFSDALLPFYLQDLPSKVLDAREAVLRGFELWGDSASRSEYLAQVRFRLRADFDGLSHPVAHPQYFPSDLFNWSNDERVVDGGAFDGDSIRTISAIYGNRFERLLAYEPDPANFVKLMATIDALPADVRRKVAARQVALAARQGQLYVEPTASASSITSPSPRPGRVAVDADRLDVLLEDVRPSFIKLDIEGAEIDALEGARTTILRDAPILAICVYHSQDHLWRIPLMLRELRQDYTFFLRPHNEEGWDLVCYAIPKSRLSRKPH